MSQSQTAVTYEGVLEMFHRMVAEADRRQAETDRKFQETDRKMRETNRKIQETAEQMKKTDERMERTRREISALGSRVGEIVENMIGGDIIEQFQALGYDVTEYSRNKIFALWPISVDKQGRPSIRGPSKRDRQDLPTSPDYTVPDDHQDDVTSEPTNKNCNCTY